MLNLPYDTIVSMATSQLYIVLQSHVAPVWSARTQLPLLADSHSLLVEGNLAKVTLVSHLTQSAAVKPPLP